MQAALSFAIMASYLSVIHFCLLCCCLTALANPPKFVYRADFRDPNTIFSDGFKPHGNNVDLKQHVTGASCNNRPGANSAFVATTENQNFAINWGRDRAGANSLRKYYVYTIRATGNCYSCIASLREALNRTGDQDYAALIDHYQYQEEWLALNGTTFNEVQKVDVYEWNGSVFANTGTSNNPSYIDLNTQGNPNPFPTVGNAPCTQWLLRSLLSCFTACFGLCGMDSGIFSSESSCPVAYEKNINICSAI